MRKKREPKGSVLIQKGHKVYLNPVIHIYCSKCRFRNGKSGAGRFFMLQYTPWGYIMRMKMQGCI